MSPIFVAILLGQFLMVYEALASFPHNNLDCSKVKTVDSLNDWNDKCMAESPKNEIHKLELLESCTCSLLQHELVWQSMLTHELDTLFLASKKLIDEEEDNEPVGKGKLPPIDRNHEMFQTMRDADSRFFWDKLNALIRRSFAEEESEEYGKRLMEIYAEIAYNPTTFKVAYKKRTANSDRVVSDACNALYEQFQPFHDYLETLKLMVENPRYTFKFISSDESLFKVVTVFNVCKLLATGGYVLS